MELEIYPTGCSLGASVVGLDFSSPLSSDEIAFVRNLFSEHQVLIFKNQELSPEQQIEACSQFGEVELHPSEEVPWKYRELTYVANVNLEGDLFEHCGPNFELWHSDTCYLDKPAMMSFLYAEQVPSVGGETLFANAYAAYDDLDPILKEKIEGKQAVFGSGLELMKRCQEKGYDLQIPESDRCPDVMHPVIRVHPVTNKKSIFVNWAHTDRIIDLEDSDAVLDSIYKHCRQSQYVYTHKYEQGDMVLWDNASVLHSNSITKLTEPRIMRRVMIKGDKPFYS